MSIISDPESFFHVANYTLNEARHPPVCVRLCLPTYRYVFNCWPPPLFFFLFSNSTLCTTNIGLNPARRLLAAAVVITFFVFWAPFHAQRLLFLHGQNWTHYKMVNEWLFLFGGTLYYVSWWVQANITITRWRERSGRSFVRSSFERDSKWNRFQVAAQIAHLLSKYKNIQSI